MINQDIANFLDYLKFVLQRSPDVVIHQKYNMLQFYQRLQYTKENPLFDLADTKLEDCYNWIIYFSKARIQYGPNKGNLPSHNTICEKNNTMIAFFKFLVLKRDIKLKQELIPRIKKDSKTLDWGRDEEYIVLRDAPRACEGNDVFALRNQLLIEIPLHTGLRRSEMLICTFDNFKSPTNQFEIKGKGGFINGVCFTDKIKEKVLEYEKKLIEYTRKRPFKINLIFVALDNKNRGNKMVPNTVNSIYRKYSNILIEEGKLNRKITPHMGRHNFATKCVLSGVSQQATTRLMRHRSPVTTERYYHMDNKWLKSEFDKIGNSL